MTEYTPVKLTKDSQTIEVLKLVISGVQRALNIALTQRDNAPKPYGEDFDCIAQDLDYFLNEMKLAGVVLQSTQQQKTKLKRKVTA